MCPSPAPTNTARLGGEVVVPGHPPCLLGAPLGSSCLDRSHPWGEARIPLLCAPLQSAVTSVPILLQPGGSERGTSRFWAGKGAMANTPPLPGTAAGREAGPGCATAAPHGAAVAQEKHSYVHKWGSFASDKPALCLSLLFFWSLHSSLEWPM